jgi:hypothetical protein
MKLLGIYLRDRQAAAVGGSELAGRTLRNNRGTAFQATLEQLRAEIEEDRQALLGIMGRLGVTPDPIKQSVIWTVEKLARLKLNGRLLHYSPLSRVMEFEALASGISGKRAMWTALRKIADLDDRLDDDALAALERRAEDQRARVEAIRLEAARLAFAPERRSEPGG